MFHFCVRICHTNFCCSYFGGCKMYLSEKLESLSKANVVSELKKMLPYCKVSISYAGRRFLSVEVPREVLFSRLP